jgi:hypothetical protein
VVGVRSDTVTAESTQLDLYSARKLLLGLEKTLQEIVKRDPEQEVRGIAVPVLDAALTAMRDLAPDNSVVASVRDVISAEAVEEGEPIRAVDVLLVVTTLIAVGPKPPPATRPIVVKRTEPRWPRQF